MTKSETVKKFLDPNKYISEALPAIKEKFVVLYGEEYRALIEEQFENMIIIDYQDVDYLKAVLLLVKNELSKEMQIEFLTKIGVEPNKENLKNYFGNLSFEHQIIMPISDIYRFIDNDYPDWKKNNLETKFKEFYQLIMNNSEKEFSYDEAINYFLSIKDDYYSMVAEYDLKIQDLKYYDEKSEDEETHLREISQKYLLKFLDELEEILPEKDALYINKCKENKEAVYAPNLQVYGVLVSNSYQHLTLLDAFSQSSEDKLKDEDMSVYRKKSICDDRVKYYQKKGLDLGSDYENYKNHEGIELYTPSKDLVEKIVELRTKIYNEELRERIITSEGYIENRKKIDSLNLLNRDDSYDLASINAQKTFVCPNIIEKSGTKQLFNVVAICCSLYDPYLDNTILHELNHVVESTLMNISDNKYVVQSGWDIFDCEICESIDEQNLEYIHIVREFEKFNEIMNELMSIKLHGLLNDDGIHILNDASEVILVGGNTYLYIMPLIKDFFDHFFNVIVRSRLTKDMNCLFARIGKDNFLELNQLIRDFAATFTEFVYREVKDDFNNERDTALTRKYLEMDEKSKNIFEKMLAYEKENCLNEASSMMIKS